MNIQSASARNISWTGALVISLSIASTACADPGDWHHGGTLFGELKYEQGFAHYDHVNPDASKGGRYNEAVLGGFDSFHPFIVRGRPAAGLTATGGLLYDTLMDQSIDQPSAAYGLVAEAFRYPDDFSSATFRINPSARWHDGKPITPEDVIWSLEQLKTYQPLFNNYYRNVTGAAKTDENEVTFTFDIAGNRELPFIMGDLPVLPKHWWEGQDADGNARDFSEPLNEPPLGSGPYRISDFKLGDGVTWERVEDYWAADLGTRKGRFNFDEIRFTYFGDDNALWEAFKKGGIEDIRRENQSKRWATEYTFEAFKDGRVVRNAFETTGSQPFQGFYLNTRREKFSDPRVREALVQLFDFQFMNQNLFYGLYTRTDSYFEGGELASSGLPEGRELEILEEYREQLDGRVFEEVFQLPVFEDPRAVRQAQRKAVGLFREAGYRFEGGRMLGPDGQPFTIEFLGDGPVMERVTLPYIENLKLLGIESSLRIVDTAQYKNRIDNFEFDAVMEVTRQSLSPGNEQREYWSSGAATQSGSRNYAGISDSVVDELVERLITAESREDLVALSRALDRVLLWGFYAVPHWHNPEEWYAWWSRIRFPDNQPAYTGLDIYSGWIEAD